jgi:NADH-quinone oxidoreductase subunit G
MAMNDKLVKLTIDGIELEVPEGTLLVDAAKQVGIDIPVFCYHPKMKPVGMCRMCLVEIGRPGWDRATGQPLLDESGDPVIQFGPNLETACTTPVGEGWVVHVSSEKAIEGREAIVEFLLTSHPLDCPICDKGGECPLQNLTMAHGPGESRFLFDEKMKMDKHVPLGDLIFLDRERCIQCGRCVRFQEEIVDDPVLEFAQRGRRLEIVTYSDPGFNSIFSGNTTDICPVGALTTADFRFGARPWELNAAASVCNHCPVGCNLTVNTRREARSNGREVIKRIMPRQNEEVNEIWICDKGRFVHHFAGSEKRITQPMIRKEGKLTPVGWDEALDFAAKGLRSAQAGLVGIVGGRASNEDLFNLRSLIEARQGRIHLADRMAGGEFVQQFGVSRGSNLSQLGAGDAILVIATDLHQEAPIWWLRVKQAVERGAELVVINLRPTRLDDHATHRILHSYGNTLAAVLAVAGEGATPSESVTTADNNQVAAAGKALSEAQNLVIFYGREGVDYHATQLVAQTCAAMLSRSGRAGKPDNGMIPVWPKSNTQGAWELGIHPPEEDLAAAVAGAKAFYILAADPVADVPEFPELDKRDFFVIVQELFLTKTAMQADVVFPAQSIFECEGSYTTGERRVQRAYPTVQAMGESRPGWKIIAQLGSLLEIDIEDTTASLVMEKIAATNPSYEGVSYKAISAVEPQWPIVGDDDLYYGGTAYKNFQGLGIQIPTTSKNGSEPEVEYPQTESKPAETGLVLVPISELYDRGTLISTSEVLEPRLTELRLHIHPEEASGLGLKPGQPVEVRWKDQIARLELDLLESIPRGLALVPRSMGLAIEEPAQVEIIPIGVEER